MPKEDGQVVWTDLYPSIKMELLHQVSTLVDELDPTNQGGYEWKVETLLQQFKLTHVGQSTNHQPHQLLLQA